VLFSPAVETTREFVTLAIMSNDKDCPEPISGFWSSIGEYDGSLKFPLVAHPEALNASRK
jgi:hypothetical protein